MVFLWHFEIWLTVHFLKIDFLARLPISIAIIMITYYQKLDDSSLFQNRTLYDYAGMNPHWEGNSLQPSKWPIKATLYVIIFKSILNWVATVASVFIPK